MYRKYSKKENLKLLHNWGAINKRTLFPKAMFSFFVAIYFQKMDKATHYLLVKVQKPFQ